MLNATGIKRQLIPRLHHWVFPSELAASVGSDGAAAQKFNASSSVWFGPVFRVSVAALRALLKLEQYAAFGIFGLEADLGRPIRLGGMVDRAEA